MPDQNEFDEASSSAAVGGSAFTLTPVEALTILCLHVNSIITLSKEITCSGAAYSHASEESIDTSKDKATRDAILLRKFFSKHIPAVSLQDYLLRLHQHCPTSAAVYLATSCYITRMAVVERVIPVTTHNAHRLVLAGLRVATKVLEDLHHSHQWFSKVGGVSESQLTRLEVGFCFLMDFDLKLDGDVLCQEITMFQERCEAAFQGHCIAADMRT